MLGDRIPKPPQGYTIQCYSPINQATPGSGLAILIHTSQSCRQINLNSPLQAQACRFGLKRQYTVCNLYLSPNEPIDQNNLNDLILQLPPPVLLVGDINARHLMWGSDDIDRHGQAIEQLLLNHDLVVLNTGSPTHYHVQTNTHSAIDLTMCSPILQQSLTWRTADDLYGSDHYPILVEEVVPEPVEREPRFIIRKAKWKDFNHLTEMTEINNEQSVEENLSSFTTKVLHAAELTIPKSAGGPLKHRCVWWRPEITHFNLERKSALRRYQRSGRDVDKISYKRWRAKAAKIKSEARKNSWRGYVSTLTADTPMSKIWNRVGKMTGRYSQHHAPCLLGQNGPTADPDAVVEILADHYENVSSSAAYSPDFIKIKEKNESIRLKFHTKENLPYNDPITLREMRGTLRQCKNTASGSDEVRYEMLKHLHTSALGMLLGIFNQVWLTGQYPSQWKSAHVLSFKKPGKPATEPSSYRPIALTSCIGKLMEKLIGIRLMNHIESNSLLSPYQYGYRKFLSSPDALIRLSSDILEAIDNKEHLVAIFFDMAKAYDTTWRYGILKSIHRIGIRGAMALFIQNFLTDRTFQTKVGRKLSAVHDQEEGVPQGSVLSCYLFILAIDEIVNCLPHGTKCSLYVDDFMVYASSHHLPALERRLQLAVNNVSQYAKQNGWTINLSKTEAVHFNRKRGHAEPNLTLNGRMIQFKPHARFLGIIFDQRLNWKANTAQLKSACMKRLNLLQCLSHTDWGSDRVTLLKLYRALVRSKIDYGCMIYGSASERVLNSLQPVQNKAIRLATGAFRSSPVASLAAESGEPPLNIRRAQLILQFYTHVQLLPNSPTYKCIHRTQLHEAAEGTFANMCSKSMEVLGLPHLPVMSTSVPDVPIWNIPHDLICSDFEYSKKDDYNQYELQLMYRHHQHACHNRTTHIYTDGSKTDDLVGCASVSEQSTITRKLTAETSIFTAELVAIVDALTEVENSNDMTFTIFSDSRSALMAINKYNNQHPIVIEILRWLIHLSSRHKTVNLCWVPAHVNIAGNERADGEARAAAATNGPAFNRSLPHRDYFMYIKQQAAHYWSSLWMMTEETNKLRCIKDTVTPWPSSSQHNRRREIVLTRLRIGHTRLTHGFLMERGTPPECPLCHEQITVRHLLADCPLYIAQRLMCYPSSVNMNSNETLQLMLSQQPRTIFNTDKLFEFIQSCGIIDIV